MAAPVPRQYVPEDIDAEAQKHFQSYPWCEKFFQDSSLQPVLSIHQYSWLEGTTNYMSTCLRSPGAILALQSFHKVCGPQDKTSSVDGNELWTLYSVGTGVESFMHTAHGGFIASLLDSQTASVVLAFLKTAVPRTASSSVRYHRALVTPNAALCRGWVSKVEGRKVWVKAVLENEAGELLAEMDALWIALKSAL